MTELPVDKPFPGELDLKYREWYDAKLHYGLTSNGYADWAKYREWCEQEIGPYIEQPTDPTIYKLWQDRFSKVQIFLDDSQVWEGQGVNTQFVAWHDFQQFELPVVVCFRWNSTNRHLIVEMRT